MAYAKGTPAQDLLDTEVAALKAQAEAIGLHDFDPFTACDGVAWVKSLLADNPALTVEELRLAFVAKEDGDKGAWAAGLLSNQWDNLYKEFRATLMSELHGDNCTLVVMRIGKKLAKEDRKLIKERFLSERSKTGRDPSTDLDFALKQVAE